MSNYEVKILRMLGSDDVIAKAKQIGKNRYKIKDACVVRVDRIAPEEGQSEDDKLVKFGISLSQFLLPYMKQDAEVEVDVMFVVDPESKIIEKYNRLFSPIIVPSLNTNQITTNLSLK